MTVPTRRRPLTAFFVLAYLGSWVAWSPLWLSRNGLGLLPFQLPASAVAGITVLGLFAGPFAAGLVVTGITEGRDGLRKLLHRVVQWRARPVWYVLAVLLIPLATVSGYLVVPGTVLSVESGGIPLLGMLTVTYLAYFVGGAVQEELGWRGFALPRLQERLHPMAAALALGVIHCFWHAPLFLTDARDSARAEPSQLLAYLVLVVSMSFVLSWLANGSGGSVLLVSLGHNGINWVLAGSLTGRPMTNNWPAALGLAGLAIITIVATRGRLGTPDRCRPDGRSGSGLRSSPNGSPTDSDDRADEQSTAPGSPSPTRTWPSWKVSAAVGSRTGLRVT